MWHTFQLVYRLESPLHVGWRKAGNLQQTRRYVGGRAWWGCCTSSLAEALGRSDYEALGRLVSESLVFGYYYVATAPGKPLLPRWERGGLRFGGLPVDQFDSRFLGSLASTAVDHRVGSSEEGSLHEVEYLAPAADTGQPVYLAGHLFARESAAVSAGPNDLMVLGRPLFSEVLARVQLGGERRYGFGRLSLQMGHVRRVDELFGLAIDTSGVLPRVAVGKEQALLAHTHMDSLEALGEIEPMVGREWHAERGPGRRVTSLLGLCYVPGAIAEADSVLAVGPFGIWTSGGSTA